MEKSKFLKLALFFGSVVCFVKPLMLQAQHSYQVNGENLELFFEEEGELSLLSERSQKNYRFFLAKDNKIVELQKESYLETISKFTEDTQLDISKVSFDIRSLVQIIQAYNAKNTNQLGASTLTWRLGVWSGLSNFTNYQNTSNTYATFTGVEFEIYNSIQYTRNSLFTQLRGTFPSNDKLDLTFMELMIGYRFKLVQQESFHFYFESELITFSRYTETFTNDNEQIFETTQTNTALSTPIGLGLGAAFFMTDRLLLTLGYSNIVRLGENTRSDFPIDFRLGLRFGF